ncbi:MAG: M56 family metallopeptidase [Kangiellaceae bacterium]|nr:M56 family metallopeptidase [Kangiellaceae bacterium]
MNSDSITLLQEFLINYWLHSTFFVGVVLVAYKLKWLAADGTGEFLAKCSLFAGLITAVIFTSGLRVVAFDNQFELNLDSSSIAHVSNRDLAENSILVNPPSDSSERTHQINTSSRLKVKPVAKRVTTNRDVSDVPVLTEGSGTAEIASVSVQNWLSIAVYFWIGAALIFVASYSTKIVKLHYLLRQRKQILDIPVIESMERIKRNVGVNFPVILSESSQILSPIVFGKREIVLPKQFSEQYQIAQVEAALAHELGHILRRDSLWRKVLVVFNSLFFFQPLNKILAQRLYEIAEQRSDQFAETSTGNSRALAEALLITAQNNFSSSQNQWVPAMKSNKSQLLVRVEALLSQQQSNSSRFSVIFGVMLSAVIVLAMPGFSIGYLEAKESDNYSRHSHSTKNQVSTYSSTSDQDGVKTKMEVKLQGGIEFNDAETAIVKFPADSYLDISIEERGEDEQRILIERDGNDDVEYTYYLDGDKRPFDSEAKEWFASALPTIFRQTGLNAKERVARIKKNGGDQAVLEEVTFIKSDFVQGVYMKELFAISQLSEDDFSEAMTLTENIQSDFEISNVLSEAVSTQSLSNEKWAQLFKSSMTIQSDFELSGLLKKTVSHLSNEGKVQDYFFEAADSIQSDFEMKNLFAHFLSNQKVDDEFLLKMFRAAEEIQSDFELASLLQLSNQQSVSTQVLFDAYIKLAKSISSDFEMRRAFESIISDGMSDAQLIDIIDTASDHISSDFELASVLTSVIDASSSTDSVREALYHAADNISSSYESNRVLRKLRN